MNSIIMSPWIPLIGCSFYGLSLYLLWPIKKASPILSRETIKMFVLLHNVFLTLFSAFVFAKTIPDFIIQLDKWPFGQVFFRNAYRGQDWDKFAPYAFAFYLSKYYEFVDTWIILLKGGKPMALQIYHHIGAVITMWAIVTSKTPPTWGFVICNSFIHTIMYAYYTITTLGYKPSFKILITLCQILQFFTGISVAFGYVLTEGSLTPIQTAALLLTTAYVKVVLYLFCEFSYNTYFKKVNDVLKKGDIKEE